MKNPCTLNNIKTPWAFTTTAFLCYSADPKYGDEGNNEFHEAVPDDPYTIADNILHTWKEYNKAEDIEEVQELYDSYFSN